MALVERLRGLFEIGRHPLRLVGSTERSEGGFVIETLSFVTSNGEKVRGILTRPAAIPIPPPLTPPHKGEGDFAGVVPSKTVEDRLQTEMPAGPPPLCGEGLGVGVSPKNDRPLPAILYIHAHGDRYDIGASELTDGRPALQSPLGPVLARAGYVTLAIDLPCFGERSARKEQATAKVLLWRGRSLAGKMLGELSSALDYLAARPDVDPGRIGVFGISMGATFGYWLAAGEPRLACVMHLCCFADFGELIETGAHDRHGIYLTIPGLLEIAGNGEIAGLIAPRPQLICIGDRDPLTPPHAFDPAYAETLAAYEASGASENLVLHREAETGHQESAAMRRQVLSFAATHLKRR